MSTDCKFGHIDGRTYIHNHICRSCGLNKRNPLNRIASRKWELFMNMIFK